MTVPPSIGAATVSSTDPLDTSINGSVSATAVQIGVAVTAAILILILAVLYALFRRVRRVRLLLRELDVFYDLVHYIQEGAPQSRLSRGLGGFFTVIALIVMVTLVSIALIEYVLVPSYNRSLSPKASPFQPVGLFNFSLVLYSAPACQWPIIVGPTDSQLQGASAHGWQLQADGTCTMYWSCTACVSTSAVLTTSFTLTDPSVYAAGMDYGLTFPGFAPLGQGSVGAPFMLSSSLWPASPLDSVFRGSSPTEISISLVPVVLRSSPAEVGTFAQLIGVTPGPQVNAVTPLL